MILSLIILTNNSKENMGLFGLFISLGLLPQVPAAFLEGPKHRTETGDFRSELFINACAWPFMATTYIQSKYKKNYLRIVKWFTKQFSVLCV